MAISGYIGLQGTGKSYGVVENVILPALKQGRIVYTNIPMNLELLEEDGIPLPVLFEIEDIKNNPKWFEDILPAGTLFVLDEVMMLWPSGLKATTVDKSHLNFITQHRHMVGEDGRSTEIVLLTQRLSLIANFARSTIEKTHVVNNLQLVGKPKSYRVDIYPGAVTQDRPNPANKVREIFGSYKPEIYKYYQSHTQSVDGQAGDETRIDKRFNIFSGWKLKIIGISIIVLFALAIWGVSGVFDFFKPNQPPVIDTVIPSAVSTQSKQSNSSGNTSQPIHSPVNNVVKKEPEDKFFSQVTRIYIALNMGVYPKIDYKFKAYFGDSSFPLNIVDLSRLGYTLKPINNCLVVIKKRQFEKYVSCEPADNSNSLMHNLVASSNSNF